MWWSIDVPCAHLYNSHNFLGLCILKYCTKLKWHIFMLRVADQWDRLPREVVESPSLETPSSSVTCSGWSCLGGVDWIISRSSFQPLWFCKTQWRGDFFTTACFDEKLLWGTLFASSPCSVLFNRPLNRGCDRLQGKKKTAEILGVCRTHPLCSCDSRSKMCW